MPRYASLHFGSSANHSHIKYHVFYVVWLRLSIWVIPYMTDYIVCTRTRYVPIFVYTVSLLNTVIYMFPYLYYNLELNNICTSMFTVFVFHNISVKMCLYMHYSNVGGNKEIALCCIVIQYLRLLSLLANNTIVVVSNTFIICSCSI